MRKLIFISAALLAACAAAPGLKAQEPGDRFAFVPDTAAIRNSWQTFFADPLFTSLSTETRKNLTDKLFTDLIAGDTAYLAWPAELRGEAKKVFYTKAGFPPAAAPGEKLSAEKIIKRYDAEEKPEGQAAKERRLGEALARSGENRLPSPAEKADESLPKTEIPKADPSKLPMPIGRSWFRNDPLEELRGDPDFAGYMVIYRSGGRRRAGIVR